MAKITEVQKAEFENKLFAKFPDVKASGTVSRKQLIEIREDMGNQFHPLWLMQNVVGRGLYAIDGGAPAVVGNTVTKPIAKRSEEHTSELQSH